MVQAIQNNIIFFFMNVVGLIIGLASGILGIIDFISKKDRISFIKNFSNKTKMTVRIFAILIGLSLVLSCVIQMIKILKVSDNLPLDSISDAVHNRLKSDNFKLNNDWVIYVNDNSELRKISLENDLEKDKSTLISDDCYESLVVTDEWIYYNSNSQQFMRIRIEGTDKVVLCDTSAVSVTLIGDRLYYLTKREAPEEYLYLCGMRADGTDKSNFGDDPVSEYTIYDDDVQGSWLYYINGSSNLLYHTKLSEFNPRILDHETAASKIAIADNFIYFVEPKYPHNMYKISIFGKGKECILKFPTSERIISYKLHGETIYFTTTNASGYGLSRMNTDGTQMVKLVSDTAEITKIDNGWLYYKTLGNYYRIRLNEKSKPEKMAGPPLLQNTGFTYPPYKVLDDVNGIVNEFQSNLPNP